MKKWFDSLDAKMKGVVVIIALILVIYIISTAKSYVNTFFSRADAAGEKAALAAQGMKASHSKSQYNTFADQLEAAMRGWGTDEETIWMVLGKIKNDIDFINLNQAYGLRESEARMWDLATWMRGDLSADEIKKANSILSNNGVTKQF